MIGIIGAMEEEVNAILDKCEINQEKQILDCHFYEGKVFDKDIVVLQGGIGKVNAAICTSILISEYHPNFIINIGSAGGLQSNQNVGDVVISKEVAYHDVDVTAFGRQIGEIPGMPVVFKADSILVDKAKTILNEMNITYHHGLIVSGDQFIHQKVQVDEIKNNFPNALCSEMESTAIAQTCYKYQIPFIITRSLSDVFGKGNSSIQFDEYLKKASEASAKLCVELVKVV